MKTIDTNDVDWVFRDEDDDMDAGDVRIKEIATTSKRAAASRGGNQMEWETAQVRHYCKLKMSTYTDMVI